MATPAWLAATVGYRGNAGQVNQFLGTHTSQWVYTAVLQTQEGTGSSVYQSLETGYLSQEIMTGATQTEIGSVTLQISTVGGSPITATINPLTVSLYASAGGLPTGSPLASTQVAEPYVYSQPFWVSVPLLATGLAPSTTYCLVVTGTGSSGSYYVWQESNQVAGAASSTDGVTWTAQPYGLMWQVYDATAASGQLLSMVDDDGARVTVFTYTGNLLTGLTEYTIAQDGSTLVSTRTLTYSGSNLIGVS